MTTKKELKQQYKEMKTPMGVFMVRNNENGKAYIGVSKDTTNIINRFRFQLKLGSHMVREMQKDWKEYGESSFSFEVLENLRYDDKDPHKDYTEDLEILKMIWLEKLDQLNITGLYIK